VAATLVVDGWAVTFGTARRLGGCCSPPRPLFAVPKLMGGLLHLVQRGGDWVAATLVVDGWAVTFGTARRLGGCCSPPRPLFAVPNVTADPSMASVPYSYYSMWHYNCLWSLKG